MGITSTKASNGRNRHDFRTRRCRPLAAPPCSPLGAGSLRNQDKPMTYAPHQQRVVDEKTELDERLGKLHDFIQENPIFKTLPEDEQKRLQRQDLVMAEYSQILSERIAAFTA